MRTINREIACALIESADGKVLMGLKDPHGGGVFVDRWQIPGGGIEDGESVEQALKREVLEEVGINLNSVPATITLIDSNGSDTATKRLSTGEEVNCNMKFFVYRIVLTTTAQNTPTAPGSDFIKCSWFSHDEIPKDKLVPAGKILFKKLNYIA